MDHNYKYIGCFLPYEDLHQAIAHLEKPRLFRSIRHPHITFAYMPETVDTQLFGTPMTVRVTGYGCDGRNEGLRVELVESSEAVSQLFRQIPTPHITVSVAKDAQPVDTNYIQYQSVPPFTLQGIFGGCTMDSAVITTPGGVL